MWMSVYIGVMLIAVDLAFMQTLDLPLLSTDATFILMMAVQVMFVLLYFRLGRERRKYGITSLLLHNSGGTDIALYDGKGKRVGVRGSFFPPRDPMLSIEKRALKFDFNDPLALSKLRTALLSGSDVTVEIALDGGGGDVVFAKVSVKFFPRSHGYVLWKMQDITPERTISEVFRKELKYLSEFMDNLPIGLYLADSAGKIRFVNNSLCEWLGLTYKQIEGRKISEFTESGQSPDFSGSWQGTLSFKGPFGSFPAFVRHLGYDKGGETMFRSVVVKDVEQGDRATKLLREAEIRFQWIFEETPVGIAFLDTEYVINDGNDALFRLLGGHRERIIGSRLIGYIHEGDVDKLDEARASVVTGVQKEAKVDLRIVGKTGQLYANASVFITVMTGLDYSKNSHADGLVMHFIDTTERTQLAEQFSQAQKMQAMGLMAGGIAHNFNNTLTAIIGFCDLLLQKIDVNDPSHEDILRIKQNADRSAGLVGALLIYSRNQPLKAKKISLTSFMADIHNFISVSIPASIHLKMEHSRHIGNILFDEVKLQQIIINLVNNARDAIYPNNGHIIIRTRPEILAQPLTIENDELPPGKYVVIEIEDNGSGIDPEIMPKIFDPFFSTKKDSKMSGSGFGLSIALGDVRQAGGFIGVESHVGSGTKFIIYLPEYDKDDGDTAPAAETENGIFTSFESPLSVKTDIGSDGQMSFVGLPATDPIKPVKDTSGNARILFVEDEEAVRTFGVRALRNKGYVVTDCACAEDALELIAAGTEFDLLATDVVMPGMSGTELVQEVKKIIPDIKVLLMSGYFADIANVGNDDSYFLSKPFSLEQLTSRIKEIIEE